jgi:CubicO group peptidase (beta-lactamase class C family)
MNAQKTNWHLKHIGLAFSVLGIGLLVALVILGFQPVLPSRQAEGLEEVIARLMRERKISGLSLAIVQQGKIVQTKGYGYTDQTQKTPVTTETLFQAGSISKPVAALGTLHWVERNRLSLDSDVNDQLRSWKVPENEFTRQHKVTLRGILSHSAGLTVHGFPGYEVASTLPSLVQVLDGVPPANSPAIRVDAAPNSLERYSGGGYTVLQQWIMDVTGKPFSQFMHETVLKPLGMIHSTYDQPLSPEFELRAASGHDANGHAIVGRWHIYPELAAAGLWTTPSDLARFLIGIQKALAGKSNLVISPSMAQQMLSKQINNVGLGLFLEGEGSNLFFMHDGRNEGFDALMLATAHTGVGLVIMINANDDSGVLREISAAICKEYH